jgi:hypothetical protein
MQHIVPCEPFYCAGQELWELHESDHAEDLPAYQETAVSLEKKASSWLSDEIIKSIDNRVDELSPLLHELSLKIHGTSMHLVWQSRLCVSPRSSGSCLARAVRIVRFNERKP